MPITIVCTTIDFVRVNSLFSMKMRFAAYNFTLCVYNIWPTGQKNFGVGSEYLFPWSLRLFFSVHSKIKFFFFYLFTHRIFFFKEISMNSNI